MNKKILGGVVAVLMTFDAFSGVAYALVATDNDDATGVDAQVAKNAAADAEAARLKKAHDETIQAGAQDDATGVDAQIAKNAAADAAAKAPKSPLMGTGFRFDPSSISPSTKTYADGSGNITPFLKNVARILLIIVSTGAVLSIVIGGFYMATSGGDSEKANKGKIIITYNIIAICVALFAYGIIQFVTWIIWA